MFACEDMAARTVLEKCPVLVIHPAENEEHIRKSNMYNYTYNWPVPSSGQTTQAFPLGLGSLFNHSNDSKGCNVGWTKHPDLATQLLDSGRVAQGNDYIKYVTLRAVEAGEELCISYGPKERLTFVDVEEEKDASDQQEGELDDNQALQDITLNLDNDE